MAPEACRRPILVPEKQRKVRITDPMGLKTCTILLRVSDHFVLLSVASDLCPQARWVIIIQGSDPLDPEAYRWGKVIPGSDPMAPKAFRRHSGPSKAEKGEINRSHLALNFYKLIKSF